MTSTTGERDGGRDAALRRAGTAVAGAACVLLVATGVPLLVRADPAGTMTVGDRIAFVPLTLFGLVGLVLVRRFPRHPVAWLLSAFALLFGLSAAGDVLAAGTGPLAEVGGWLASWLWVVAIPTLGLAMVLFPDGRLPSPRWRPAVALELAAVAGGVALGAALWPQRHLDLVGLGDAFPGAGAAVGQVALPLVVLGFAVAVASLFRRAVGASPVTRLQLKWLLLGVALLAAALLAASVRDRYGLGHPVVDDLLGVGGLTAVPVAIGVAVTRYRLYDIDRLISRTLAYTIVVAGCLAVYAAGVLVLQRLSGAVVGGSDLAVAASTLAAAAAARPLLVRTRRAVDRRFDRAAYDGALLVAGFVDRSRREVDATDLHRDLVGTVRSAVGPRTVGLVLLEPRAEAGGLAPRGEGR